MRETAAWIHDLQNAVEAERGADLEIYACVNGLRGNGVSWERIASILGVTRQAAWERFRAYVQPPQR